MGNRYSLLLLLFLGACVDGERPSDTVAKRMSMILKTTAEWLGIEDQQKAEFNARLTVKTEVVDGRARARGLLLLPVGTGPKEVERQLNRVLGDRAINSLTNVLLVTAREEHEDGREGAILGAGYFAPDGLGWTGEKGNFRQLILGADALKTLEVGQ